MQVRQVVAVVGMLMATSFGFLPGALAADVYENVWTDVSTLSNDYPNAPSDWFYPGDPLTIELMNDVVNSDGNEDIFDTAAYHPRCGRFACDWTGSEHITLLDIDDAVLDSSGRFTHTYPGDDTKSLYDGDYRIWAAYEDYHENSGPGGFFVHLGRIFVLGKAPQELVDTYGAMLEAQKFTLGLLKPGAAARDVFAEYNAYMRSRGFPEERRLHCHGQGYEVVERPLMRNDETMTIAANMNIGIHPSISNEKMFVTVCDNFLVRADGTAERLHKTPQEIVEL